MKAKLYLLENEEPVELWEMSPDQPVRIGREDDNQVRPRAHGISRHHAEAVFHDGAWHVRDLGSTNGTLVNGVKIARNAEQRLEDGDSISVGSAEFLMELWDPRLRCCPVCGEGEVFDEHVLVGDELGRDEMLLCARCGALIQEDEDGKTYRIRFVPGTFAGRLQRLGSDPHTLEDLEAFGEDAADELEEEYRSRRPPTQAAKPPPRKPESVLVVEDQGDADQTDELTRRAEQQARQAISEIVAEVAATQARTQPAPQPAPQPAQQEPALPEAKAPDIGVEEALKLAEMAERGEKPPATPETAVEPPPRETPEAEKREYVPPAEAAPAPEIAPEELLSSVGVEARIHQGAPAQPPSPLETPAEEPKPQVVSLSGGEQRAKPSWDTAATAPASPPSPPLTVAAPPSADEVIKERVQDPDWVKDARAKQRLHREIEREEEARELVRAASEAEAVAEEARVAEKKDELLAKIRTRRRRLRRMRERAARVEMTLSGVFPDPRRLVAALVILALVGGFAWGYLRLLDRSGPKAFMVKCKSCGNAFAHTGPEEKAFGLKCKSCGEKTASVVFACRSCGHVMWLNSATEFDGKKCPSCNSPRVGFAYPGRDGQPGTLERARAKAARLAEERAKTAEAEKAAEEKPKPPAPAEPATQMPSPAPTPAPAAPTPAPAPAPPPPPPTGGPAGFE